MSEQNFTVFMPIEKIDKKKRTVSGYASTQTRDSDGEVISLQAVKAALPDYMSFGNIREMHKLSAVGTAEEANIDSKGLFLTAKIVDDAAWKKCEEKVYKGFSIGGSKLAKTGDTVTKIKLTEISVVDRPANPDCRFQIAKCAKEMAEGDLGHLLKSKEAKEAERLAKANNPPAAHDGLSLPAKPSKEGKDTKPDVAQPENKAKKKKKLRKEIEKAAKRGELLKALGLDSLETKPDFLELGSQVEPLAKGMGTAGTLAYTFDSIRSTQRQLISEASREGGDKKDKDLAKQLGQIAKQLAAIISTKAEHEGAEALDFSDADDSWLRQSYGKELDMPETVQKAAAPTKDLGQLLLGVLQKAVKPSAKDVIKSARKNLKEAKKAKDEADDCMKALHKMHKEAYLGKMAKGEASAVAFDHQAAMETLSKAYAAIQKMGGFMKSAKEHMEKAEGIVGQHGEMVQDGNAHYEVPPGVKGLNRRDLATAGPGGTERGSEPPAYPGDGSVYAGKASKAQTLAKALQGSNLSAEVVEIIMDSVRQEGELEALRKLPVGAAHGRRPFSFDMSKVAGGGEQGRTDASALFKGVDTSAIGSGDENAHTQATAKVIGNLLTSGNFGKSILSPDFHGAAGGRS